MRLPTQHWRPAIAQVVRFGIAGGLCTVVYSAVYLMLANFLLPPGLAAVAVPPSFLVALICGFYLHRNWSFKGHAATGATGLQPLRFVVVQLFGLALNTLLTWIVTASMHLPNWVALIPVVSITPAITFLLQRNWVFGPRGSPPR